MERRARAFRRVLEEFIKMAEEDDLDNILDDYEEYHEFEE